MGLSAAVRQRYEIIHADSPQLLDEVFRLRYRVICCEAKIPGFGPERYAEGREYDEFDWRSAHCLLRDRAGGSLVGSVRLVLADPDDPSQPFPTEVAIRKHFDPLQYDALRLPRRQTGEISRLILARSTWRQVETAGYALVALLTAILQMSLRYGVVHWIAIMEPSLNRRLHRFHVDLSAVGPPIEHYGIRQAHSDAVSNVLARMFNGAPEVWEAVTTWAREYSTSTPPQGFPSMLKNAALATEGQMSAPLSR